MSSLAWSGLTAGLSMGLSLVAEGLIRQRLPEADWSELVSSLGYTLGFLVVAALNRAQVRVESRQADS